MLSDTKPRPKLFVVPGLASTSQSCYIRQIVDRAVKDGYDIIVINYRGLAGAELKTPTLFCSDSMDDFLEPMKFYHQMFGKRKMMAVGCSMGAGILANILGNEGENCFLEAACIF